MKAAALVRTFSLLPAMVFGLLLCAASAVALNYPELTGRVVDDADLLSPAQEADFTKMLEQHERKTSNQVVIVTVTSLQGSSIENFGRSLGNHWGIGQRNKDNGVLLLVAPQERRVRIEVGRGLESELTNRIAQDIIDRQVLPQFRKDNMSDGIRAGTIAIIQVLEGKYRKEDSSTEWQNQSDDKSGQGTTVIGYIVIVALVLCVLGIFSVASIGTILNIYYKKKLGRIPVPDDVSRWTWFFVQYDLLHLSSDSTSGFSGFGGGSFSGGGGSFGGGGASGSW